MRKLIIISMFVITAYNIFTETKVGLNYFVEGKPGYLYSDPAVFLNFNNKHKLVFKTGLGFYTYSEDMNFLLDLGFGYERNRLSLAVSFENSTPIKSHLFNFGHSKQIGFTFSAGYKVSNLLDIDTYNFQGKLELNDSQFENVYYNVTRISSLLYYDVFNTVKNSISITDLIDIDSNNYCYSFDLLLDISLLNRDLKITPRLMYTNSITNRDVFNDLIFDFSSYTTGSNYGDLQGNISGLLSLDYRIFPLKKLYISYLDKVFISAFADIGVFIDSTKHIDPDFGYSTGSSIGMIFFNMVYQFTYTYNSINGSGWSFLVDMDIKK